MSAESRVGSEKRFLLKRVSSVGFAVRFFFSNFFIYFWLCWNFAAARGLFSSCGEQGVGGLLSCCGAWASHCSDFSCCKAQTLGTWGLSSCGSEALEHRLLAQQL